VHVADYRETEAKSIQNINQRYGDKKIYSAMFVSNIERYQKKMLSGHDAHVSFVHLGPQSRHPNNHSEITEHVVQMGFQ
jgi:hypothetical protein